MCDLNDVESKSHFLLYCMLYDFRAFGAILKRNPKMFYWSDEEKLSWMFFIFLNVLISFFKPGKESETVCVSTINWYLHTYLFIYLHVYLLPVSFGKI